MFLKELQIKNVRLLSEVNLNFHPKINIFTGINGQGKTSVLEAVYYLSISKSFRAKGDDTVLKNKEPYLGISGVFQLDSDLQKKVRIHYSVKEGKHVFINDVKIAKFSELIGAFPLILLSLEDLELIYGQPASRRKFLDILLSQLFPAYLVNLQKYKRCLGQKNKVLNSDEHVAEKDLAIWNKQLVEYGSEIIFQRTVFIHFLNKNIQAIYNNISGNKENISSVYKATVAGINSAEDGKNIKNHFEKAIKENLYKEIKRKSSLIGPHRDDIEFLKDNFPFKSHGSQGEIKSFLLALKFLESKYIREKTNTQPMILLDDIFGELDNKRIDNLLKLISESGQTFITTTDTKKFSTLNRDNHKSFVVTNGLIN